MPETQKPARPELSRSERVEISCPGCGRHDFVSWPAEQPIYHWKCFNCGKQFDLTRDEGH
jgi:DNA-directed RNA polymerase subunit RPC12/RpoP